jgi:hypothetical protein
MLKSAVFCLGAEWVLALSDSQDQYDITIFGRAQKESFRTTV